MGPPVIGQRCIVFTSGSRILGILIAGYSSQPSPINGSKRTHKWLGRPLFWSLKYGQLCTRDDGCQPGVTLPVNTNARIDYETIRTRLASGERSLHPASAAYIRRAQLASGDSKVT